MRQKDLYETAKFQHVDWSPDTLRSKLSAWYDVTDVSTLDLASGAVIANIRDKSGKGNTANRSDTTERVPVALLGTARSEGFIATSNLDVSTKEQCFVTPSITASQVFAVAVFGDGTTTTNPSSVRSYIIANSATTLEVAVKGGATNNGIWDTTNPFGTIYVNGSTTSSTQALPMPLSIVRADHATSATSAWVICGNTSLASRNWYGGLCEILIFSSKLTDDERTRLEGYLAHKYNITKRLAANHPYIARPPTC